MDLLYELINSLSDQESQRFRRTLSQKGNIKERKDLKLYDLFRTTNKIDNESAVKAVYKQEAGQQSPPLSHAYHQPRQTLTQKREHHIRHAALKEGSSLSVMRLLSIARFLFTKKKYQPAWTYFLTAEEY